MAAVASARVSKVRASDDSPLGAGKQLSATTLSQQSPFPLMLAIHFVVRQRFAVIAVRLDAPAVGVVHQPGPWAPGHFGTLECFQRAQRYRPRRALQAPAHADHAAAVQRVRRAPRCGELVTPSLPGAARRVGGRPSQRHAHPTVQHARRAFFVHQDDRELRLPAVPQDAAKTRPTRTIRNIPSQRRTYAVEQSATKMRRNPSPTALAITLSPMLGGMLW